MARGEPGPGRGTRFLSPRETTVLPALGLLVLLFLLSLGHYRPSHPVPADAPADRFSADRAWPILAELVGDGIPHPYGSHQHGVVRNRVLDILTRSGYEPQLQLTTARSSRGERAVENIVAVLPGTGAGRAVLLVAHYDSVPAGPGAADDGVSVAIMLEIARMAIAEPAPRNDIIFLFTDAEEIGLWGARGFVQDHPRAPDVGVVINLEARGTSGPSLVFETGREDRWLIGVLARSVRRPFSSSLFAEIYRRMPNDTDFTIFLRAGFTGYNLAFIGSPSHYHTAGDRLENVDRGSFQHQGENTLALTRTLADLDLVPERRGRAVYFDLLGLGVVRWPLWLTLPLALLALVLIEVVFRPRSGNGSGPGSGNGSGPGSGRGPDSGRRPGTGAGRGGWRRRLGALFCVPAVLLLSLLAVLGVSWLLTRIGIITGIWVDHPFLPLLLLWGVAIVTVLLFGRALAFREQLPDSGELLHAVWLIQALLALAVGVFAPGASYIFLVPALAAGVVGLSLHTLRAIDESRFSAILSLLTLVFPALIWFELELLFADAIGFAWPPVLALRVALFATLLLPAFTWRNTSTPG